jgi:hypothetical protein
MEKEGAYMLARLVYGEGGCIYVGPLSVWRRWARTYMLADLVYGEGGRVYVGPLSVWRRWARICWPTWCMEKLGESMLACIVNGKKWACPCCPTWCT